MWCSLFSQAMLVLVPILKPFVFRLLLVGQAGSSRIKERKTGRLQRLRARLLIGSELAARQSGRGRRRARAGSKLEFYRVLLLEKCFSDGRRSDEADKVPTDASCKCLLKRPSSQRQSKSGLHWCCLHSTLSQVELGTRLFTRQ